MTLLTLYEVYGFDLRLCNGYLVESAWYVCLYWPLNEMLCTVHDGVTQVALFRPGFSPPNVTQTAWESICVGCCKSMPRISAQGSIPSWQFRSCDVLQQTLEVGCWWMLTTFIYGTYFEFSWNRYGMKLFEAFMRLSPISQLLLFIPESNIAPSVSLLTTSHFQIAHWTDCIR